MTTSAFLDVYKLTHVPGDIACESRKIKKGMEIPFGIDRDKKN
jgi:hypothetical protein